MNRRFLVPIFAVLFALAGCSDRAAAPLAPEPAPAALLGLDPVLAPVLSQATSLLSVEPVSLDGVLEFVALPDLSGPRTASKRIRASTGGYVELQGFRVDIPAGALPQDTVVTINLPADPVLGKRVIAEFLPHGVQFNTPVTLTFPLQGVTLPPGGAIEVGRWENGGWTSLGGTVSPNGKRLTSTTPHFSMYAARGGAYTMAGG
ncbi:MAG: hypothetical protein ABW277_08825 [Longimicrobiaceae bacterium]